VTLVALSVSTPARAGDDEEMEIDAAPSTVTTPPPAPPAAPPTPAPAAAPAPAAPPSAPPAAPAASPPAAPAPAVTTAPAAPAPAAPAPAAAPEPAVKIGSAAWLGALDLKVSGYAQVQYFSSEQSEDEVDVDGDPLNQDRFLVRRARLKVERTFHIARATVEIDANTVRGPALDLRHAELALFVPGKDDRPSPAQLLVGLSDLPFGAELTEGSRSRVFMERSLASRAFFAGEPDVGAQLGGALGPLRYAVAATNGQPVSDNPSTSTLPLASEPTFVGRLGADFGKEEVVKVAGGVSFLQGTGLHEGTPATKSQLAWSDSNQDGFVTLDELSTVIGQAATSSTTFTRWAVGGDLSVAFHTPLGWSRVYGEATMATNLDRNWFTPAPVSTGYDVREFGWNAGATQEVTPWALVGFRVDSYDPSSDVFDARRGEFIPLDTSVLTLSPIAGARLPGFGRLMVQYDYVSDHLSRDVTGEPVDLPNDQWTVRLQGEF